MDKCRLSIIVPVYNAEEYLDRCLVSIIEQGFSSYEVILVDDGSTDSSSLICDRYSEGDARFRTIHKKNGGVSSARNAGLDLAKGEYVMFVDSDDALLPDSLEAMFENVTNEDLAVGGYTVDKKLLRQEDYHLWIKMYQHGYRGYTLDEPLYMMRDDRNAAIRRNWRTRRNETYVKHIGYRMIGLPFYYQVFAIVPIIKYFTPRFIYDYYHRK